MPRIDLNAARPTAMVSNQAAPARVELVVGRGALGTGPEMVDVQVDSTYRFVTLAVPGPCVALLLFGVLPLRRTRRSLGTHS